VLIVRRAAWMLFRLFGYALFFTGAESNAQQGSEFNSQAGFSIYCNSNMDGTGKCSRTDNGNPLTCIMIPGQIIDCSDQSKGEFDCVQYGAVMPLQTQFFCLPDKGKSSDDAFVDDGDVKVITPAPLRAAPTKPKPSQENNLPTFRNPFSAYNENPATPQRENFQDAF
jgi:hypothetical protein